MDSTFDQERTDDQAAKHPKLPAFLLRNRAGTEQSPQERQDIMNILARNIDNAAKTLAEEAVQPSKAPVAEDLFVTEDQTKILKSYAKTVFNKVSKNEELTADERFKLRVAAEMSRRVNAGEANNTKYAYYKVMRQLRAEDAVAAQQEAALSTMETELAAALQEDFGPQQPTNNLAVIVPASTEVAATAPQSDVFEIDEDAFAKAITLTPEEVQSTSTALEVPSKALTIVQQAAKETVAEQVAENNKGRRGGFSFLRALTSIGHGVMAAMVVAAGLAVAAISISTPEEIQTAFEDSKNYISQVFEGDTQVAGGSSLEPTIVQTQTIRFDENGNYVVADTTATPEAAAEEVATPVVETPVVEAAPVAEPTPDPLADFKAQDFDFQVAVIEMMIGENAQPALIRESIEAAREGATADQARQLTAMATGAGITLGAVAAAPAEAAAETPTVAEVTEIPVVAEPVAEAAAAEVTAETTTPAAVETDFATMDKGEQIAVIASMIENDAVRTTMADVINQNILIASAGATDEAHINALAEFRTQMGWVTEEVTTVASIPTVETPVAEVAAETTADAAAPVAEAATTEQSAFNVAALGELARDRALTFEEGANAVRLFYAGNNLEVPAAMEAQLAKMGRTHITGHAEMGAFDASKILMNQFGSEEAASIAALLLETASEGNGRASRFAQDTLERAQYRTPSGTVLSLRVPA